MAIKHILLQTISNKKSVRQKLADPDCAFGFIQTHFSLALPVAWLCPHALYYCFVFCHNHFIDVFCHMLIAALEFMLCRSRETVLRTLYAHDCREIRAASGTW